MGKLNLSQPLAIMVLGLPGAGKSFFANNFANTFGAAEVNLDKIRWTLFTTHTYSNNENAMVDQVANLLTAEFLRTKQTFVLDGGCNSRRRRDAFTHIAEKAGFRVILVDVQTDTPTAKARATHRLAKNTGDQYKQSLSATQFANFAKAYDIPKTSNKNVVVISGKHSARMQLRTVLKKIIEIEKMPKPKEMKIVHKNNIRTASEKNLIQ